MSTNNRIIGIIFFLSLPLFGQNQLTLLQEKNSNDIAECATDAIYSQPATSPWAYTASCEEYNVEVFSYFHDVTNDIGSMRFWGEIIDFETFSQIDPPIEFIIRFYDGPISEVGDLLETFTLTLDGTLLEMNGSYKVWTFDDAVFPYPINMSSGWVSIQNTDPVYSFWWRDTKDAPGEISMYVNHNDGIFYTSLYPMGFCLNPYDSANNGEYAFENLTIHPNPANNVIIIRADHEIRSLAIINDLGQLIRLVLVNDTQYQLDASDFEKGIYFIRIVFENDNTITKKIVIQ